MSAQPGACSVCSRPDAEAIDARLAAGESRRAVARSVGLHRSAMIRHAARHLSRRLRLAAQAHENKPADEILERLNWLTEQTLEILHEARRSKNHDASLKAIARAESQLQKVGELTGALQRDGAATVNINVLDAQTAENMARIFLQRRGVLPAGSASEAIPTTAAAETEDSGEEEEAVP